jgi:hypothetical protein
VGVRVSPNIEPLVANYKESNMSAKAGIESTMLAASHESGIAVKRYQQLLEKVDSIEVRLGQEPKLARKSTSENLKACSERLAVILEDIAAGKNLSELDELELQQITAELFELVVYLTNHQKISILDLILVSVTRRTPEYLGVERELTMKMEKN